MGSGEYVLICVAVLVDAEPAVTHIIRDWFPVPGISVSTCSGRPYGKRGSITDSAPIAPTNIKEPSIIPFSPFIEYPHLLYHSVG
jgi:hypothetical protein